MFANNIHWATSDCQDIWQTLNSPPASKLTRGKKVEGILDLLALVVVNNNGVTGVVTAGAASADLSLRRENIDELALALVSPLGAEAGLVSGYVLTWTGQSIPSKPVMLRGR